MNRALKHLSPEQREELLLFSQDTIDNIRDYKSLQREIVASAIALMVGIVIFATQLDEIPLVGRRTLSVSEIAIATFFGYQIVTLQKRLVAFRMRLKCMFMEYWVLDVTEITKESEPYGDKSLLRIFGDLVPTYLGVLAAVAAITSAWIQFG